MTIEEIKELLAIFNESGVAELELQRGENRLRIRRAGVSADYVVPSVSPAAPAPAPSAAPSNTMTPPAAYPQAASTSPASGKPSDAADPNQVLVRSPIVGTYYDAAPPGAPPFFRVGDAGDAGQVM